MAHRKLGRVTDNRLAMLKNLVTALLENGRIVTTLYRAKETASLAEKMVSLGKQNTLSARRRALSFVTKKSVVKSLFEEKAPKYMDRSGGYTRITKIAERRGDGALMAVIELT